MIQSKANRLQNLAFIAVGGISGGSNPQGLPALVDQLDMLSKYYKVHVYSFISIDSKKIDNPDMSVFSVSGSLPLKIRFLVLFFRIIFDHLFKRFRLIQTLSAYPSGVLGITLKSTLRLPCVINYHGAEVAQVHEIGFGDLLNKSKARWVSKCLMTSSASVFISFFQMNHAIQLLGERRSQMHVFYRGVHSNKFPFKKDAVLKPPYTFMAVGYRHPVKNWPMLLETYSEIRRQLKAPTKLLIVGRNHQKTSEEIDRLGLSDSVEIIDSVPNDNMSEYYHHSHVLIHTSYYEAGPTCIIEAMMCGVVIAGTNVGIVSDLDDDMCIKSEINQPAILAAKIVEVISNPEKYMQLRLKGYQWSKERDVYWCTDQYLQLYNTLLNKSGAKISY